MNENGVIIAHIEISDIGPIERANINLPSKGLIEILGENEVGKTTFIRSIISNLARRGNENSLAVRKGKKKSEVIIYLADYNDGLGIATDEMLENKQWKYKITQTINDEGKIKKTVEGPIGGPVKRARELLDEFIQDLTCDPLSILKKPSKEQKDLLLKMNPVNVDKERLSAISGLPVNGNLQSLDLIKAHYDQIKEWRKAVNGDHTRAKSMAESIVIPPEPEKVETVSATELFKEKNKLIDEDSYQTIKINELAKLKKDATDNGKDKELFINVSNSKIAEIQRKIKNYQEEIDLLKLKIEDEQEKAKRKCNQFDQEYEEIQKCITGTEQKVSAFIPVDFTEIDQKIKDADKLNEQAREAVEKQEARKIAIQQKEKAETQASELKQKSQEYTQRLKAIQDYQAEILENYDFPLPEMGFNDDGLTYEGELLSNRGSSTNYKVCLAIAKRINPGARFILSPQEVMLDKKRRQEFHEMALEEGYQIFCCRVAEVKDEGRVSFYIEDGIIESV